MITKWEDLAGRTIKKDGVRPCYFGGYLLLFEDGEVAHIDGSGEEHHGAHWPILSEEYEDWIVESLIIEDLWPKWPRR